MHERIRDMNDVFEAERSRTVRHPHQRQDPLPNRLGQVRPGLNDDHEGDVDFGLAQRADLGIPFRVQLPPCGNCAVLCIASCDLAVFPGVCARGSSPT